MADQTRQFLSQTVGDIVNLSKRGRYIARIESAAKELGMRIAEYDEYLQTPEGSAEQEQLEQERLAQQCQTGDTPMEESSPNGPLT
jgi:antitoxin (DNA-binding transcriptional repressor) of toxin-antitoxin stability system